MSIIIALLIIAAYWTPTIVAFSRHVPNIGSVVVANIFGFALGVGWIIAMAMACRSIPVTPQYVVPPGFQPLYGSALPPPPPPTQLMPSSDNNADPR